MLGLDPSIVLEAGHRARQRLLVVRHKAVGQIAGDRPARRLVGGLGPGLEVRPEVLGDLGGQIAHAMGQAALAGRARKTGLDRLDDARRAVRGDQQGVAQTAAPHVLEEGRNRLGVLLGAGHQCEQHFPALGREAPGRQHRLALLAGPDPLGDAVDEEVDDVVLAQVTGGELLLIGPQPFAQLRDRRA